MPDDAAPVCPFCDEPMTPLPPPPREPGPDEVVPTHTCGTCGLMAGRARTPPPKPN